MRRIEAALARFAIGLLALWTWTAIADDIVPARDIREDFLLRSWDREDGVPDNRVEAVLQTKDGYIWLATPLGLARFDGFRFTVFNKSNTPAMESEACYGLVEDDAGALWVATTAGVLRRAAKGFERVEGSAAVQDWRLFCPAKGGGVWAASDEGRRLRRFHENRFVTVLLPPPIEGQIRWVHELPDGSLWIGTSAGAFRTTAELAHSETIRGLPQDIEHYMHRTVFEQDSACFDLVISQFTETAQLYRIVNGSAALCATNVVDNWGRPFFLVRDQAGGLWMPWGEGGLFRYAQGRVTPYKVPRSSWEDFAFCFYEDRDANLWFGSGRSGLHCLQPRRLRAITSQNGLPGATVECLLESRDGSIWMGTDDGLARWVDDRITVFSEQEGLIRQIVRSLAEDEEGVLWVGTLAGLNYFRDEKLLHYPLPGAWTENKVRALIAAKEGGLWVGTVSGLYRLAGRQLEKFTVADGLSTKEVLSLLEPSPGVLWVGTAGGGLNRLSWPTDSRFSPETNPANCVGFFRRATLSTWTTTNGLSNDWIRTLHQDEDGVLWIGTDRGIHRFQDGRFFVLTTQHGLLENQINALIEDGVGRFWIGGNQSLYRVSRRKLNEVAAGRARSVMPVCYDQADGIPSLDISGQYSHPSMCRTRDGRLWIGSSQGVAVLDPKSTPESPLGPSVVIEQVRANGQIVFDNGPAGTEALRSVLRFPPGSARVLEFQYMASAFVAPEKSRFKYRLEGWDKEWIEAGNGRKAYYANVTPGEYRFRVIAGNKYGIWNETGSSVNVQLEPFIYQTWWFYPVCGGVICLGLFCSVAWRIKALRKIAQLERQIALDQQRKRIARDLHDELGASLTQIAQLSGDAHALSEQTKGAGLQTGRIAALAEEAVGNIGEIVWANNPNYDSLEDLVAYLREYAAKYLSSVSLDSNLCFPEEIPACGVPGPFRRHLVAILKEALHNIVKHAQARRVEVVLHLNNGHLNLTVRDDGRGLDGDKLPRFGNGLKNMRERIAELGGSCQIECTPAEGTTVHIRLPLRNGR